jgi:hypothetical protein
VISIPKRAITGFAKTAFFGVEQPQSLPSERLLLVPAQKDRIAEELDRRFPAVGGEIDVAAKLLCSWA